MIGSLNLAMDTWVKVESDTSVEREVDPFEVQLQLGEREWSLLLVCSEDGLAKLLNEAGAALTELREKQPAEGE